MERLHPDPQAEVDVYEAYRAPIRRWLRINMVQSMDGHVTDAEGVSGSLGGEGDAEAFRAMRHHADGILVGAGTVRSEGYGRMVVLDRFRAQREADGRDGPAPIVVVSSSLDLDPSSRLFATSEAAPIVVTTRDAPHQARQDLRAAGAVIVTAGAGSVDLPRSLRMLRDDLGLEHLLCEGGPTLNGQLIGHGLVDEVCATTAPRLTGGADRRRIVTGLPTPADLTLTQVLHHQGELLLRYELARSAA